MSGTGTIRTVKRTRYTQIDNSLLENPALSWEAKGLQSYLLSRPDGWLISSRHLATIATCSKDKVQRILRDLQGFGYIFREKIRKKNGTFEWINWIYESPELNPHPIPVKSTVAVKSSPGLSSPGLSSPGLSSQNKTYLTKTEEQDLITISLPLTEEPEKSANADRASEQILEAEFWDEEPEPVQPTRESKPVQTPSFVSNLVSGEGESSAACRTTETTAITATGYLAQTEKRYSPTLSRIELTELTQTLIDTYNSSKPSSWGTCTKLTAFLVKQVDELIRVYSDNLDINEAVESLKNDIGAAFVSLRGDKFYDNKDFGQKTIGFYLDAKNVDRLQKRAQVWYDRPQQAKEQLAHKIVDERLNGTPCHLTGKILSGMIRLSTARRFKKYLGLPLDNPMRDGLPPLEHLQKYYPELLEG